MAAKKRFKEIKAKLEESRKAMEEQARSVFNEEIQTIFAQYPDLKTVSWHQYTPYFNDGDTCHFSCHGEDEVIINEDSEDEDDYEGQTGGWADKAATEVCELISTLGSDMMEHLFGDHAKVIVSRKKVEVEQYDHD